MSIAFLRYSGGYNVGDPPLPIPNREVKPNGADGTASQWESRTPPFLRSVREGGDRISPSSPEKRWRRESRIRGSLLFYFLSLQKSFCFSLYSSIAFSFSFLSFLLFLPLLRVILITWVRYKFMRLNLKSTLWRSPSSKQSEWSF